MSLAVAVEETSRGFQTFLAVLEGLVAGIFTVGAVVIAVVVERRRRRANDRQEAMQSVIDVVRELSSTVTQVLTLEAQIDWNQIVLTDGQPEQLVFSERVRIAEQVADRTTTLMRSILDTRSHLPTELVDAQNRISRHLAVFRQSVAAEAIPLTNDSGELDLDANENRSFEILNHAYALGRLFMSVNNRLRAELAPRPAAGDRPSLDFELLDLIEQLRPLPSDDISDSLVAQVKERLLAHIEAKNAAERVDESSGTS